MNVLVCSSNRYACTVNHPNSVCSKMNVNASSGSVVPSQTKRQRRRSSCGRSASAYVARTRLLIPSAATSRSVFFAQRRDVFDLRLEPQVDAQLARALLENVQQTLARDPGKTVAAGANELPFEVDIDVVPMGERLRDRAVGRFVRDTQILEGRVREHDAPAERVVGLISLVVAARPMTGTGSSRVSQSRVRPDLRRLRRCASRT